MSENSRDIVKYIARVWRLIKKQEELFRSIMGFEVPVKLRRACSNGFMLSLVYKKEIGELYESVKCNLNDGDLASITRSKENGAMEGECLTTLLSQLIEEQRRLISAYEPLLAQLDEESEAALACQRHIDQLLSLRDTLTEAYAEVSEDTATPYTSVA